MILVDTSVWIAHFRTGSERLRELLVNEGVGCHPLIVGELACGNLRDRHKVLSLLDALPKTAVAEHDEVIELVDRRRLFGRGLGWIDAHLLASSMLSRCDLWTLDKPLAKAARTIGLTVVD